MSNSTLKKYINKDKVEELTDEQSIKIIAELLRSHEKLELNYTHKNRQGEYIIVQVHALQHSAKSKVLTVGYTVFKEERKANICVSFKYFFTNYTPKKYGTWKEFLFIKGLK